MLPLTSKLKLISECPRGLIQNSTPPFGLLTNRSSNSVYPLSCAARKNACKVEWWLSVNRDDLLLISTLGPEIRKRSLEKLVNSSKGSVARLLPALSRHSLELCGWHLTTRNWPVIALHHYGMEPSLAGLAALTAAAYQAPLGFSPARSGTQKPEGRRLRSAPLSFAGH